MHKYCSRGFVLLFVAILSLTVSNADAQHSKKSKELVENFRGTNVMWEPVEIERLDLYSGPSGSMTPDLSRVKFLKKETGGNNTKYRISDGSGRVWVAKLGREARPETAAVRLLYGIGYKTEINYLVPRLTIPGKGTFTNVRLEARPADVKRLGQWKWLNNPFVGTKELQGLKMMMVFMTWWDALDLQNVILQKGNERYYVVSDLGATFGKLGNNNFPIFYRLGRSTGNAKAYATTKFIRRVKNGKIELAYKGKSHAFFRNITVSDGRWLYALLKRLSDRQISDVFRAANFSPSEVELYRRAVRNKINELRSAVSDDRLAVALK